VLATARGADNRPRQPRGACTRPPERPTNCPAAPSAGTMRPSPRGEARARLQTSAPTSTLLPLLQTPRSAGNTDPILGAGGNCPVPFPRRGGPRGCCYATARVLSAARCAPPVPAVVFARGGRGRASPRRWWWSCVCGGQLRPVRGPVPHLRRPTGAADSSANARSAKWFAATRSLRRKHRGDYPVLAQKRREQHRFPGFHSRLFRLFSGLQ